MPGLSRPANNRMPSSLQVPLDGIEAGAMFWNGPPAALTRTRPRLVKKAMSWPSGDQNGNVGTKLRVRSGVINLTNKDALYSFLTFSGTHLVTPRAYQLWVGVTGR
jgi:hypothetical protein